MMSAPLVGMNLATRRLIKGSAWTAAVTAGFIAGRFSTGGTAPVRSAPDTSASKTHDVRIAGPAGKSPAGSSVLPAGAGPDGSDAAPSRHGRPAMDALRSLRGEKDPARRMEQFLAVLSRLTPEEMPEALKFLNDVPEDTGREMSMLVHRWAGLNPQAAMDWIKASGDRNLVWWAARDLMKAWAAHDPDAALAAAESAPPGPGGNGGNPWITGVIQGIVEQDPARAGTLAARLPYGRDRGFAIDSVVDSLFRREAGGAAAKEWASALPDTDITFKQGAVGRVAAGLAASDPVQAAAWVDSLPLEQRNRALANVVSTWADSDPNAAGAWLRNYPAGPGRDEAAANFAWTVKGLDPESALTWAGTITDERRRREMTLRVAGEWMQTDAPGARAWIQQQISLPESVREELLNPRTERR